MGREGRCPRCCRYVALMRRVKRKFDCACTKPSSTSHTTWSQLEAKANLFPSPDPPDKAGRVPCKTTTLIGPSRLVIYAQTTANAGLRRARSEQPDLSRGSRQSGSCLSPTDLTTSQPLALSRLPAFRFRLRLRLVRCGAAECLQVPRWLIVYRLRPPCRSTGSQQ